MSKNIGVFAGRFDPFTNAHLDILNKSIDLFDTLYVCIDLHNTGNRLFPVSKIENRLRDYFLKNPKIIVQSCETIVTEFAESVGANFIIKGIQCAGEFDNERHDCAVSHILNPNIHTIYLLPGPSVEMITPEVVRDLHRSRKDISKFIPYNL